MSTPSKSLQNALKSLGAITALPLAIFALVKMVFDDPLITVVVVAITAILASILVVKYWEVKIESVIIAWLVLIVVMLGIYVIWPTTMTVEGTVEYTSGVPAINEKVVLVDVDGVSRETRTDETGYYQFERVPTGSYRVTSGDDEAEGGAKGTLVQGMISNLIITEPTPDPVLTEVEVLAEAPTEAPTEAPVAVIPTQIPPITLSMPLLQDAPEGQEFYFDVRIGGNGRDLTGYTLEVILEGAKGRDAQLFFKNCDFDSVYSLSEPIKNDVLIQFDPSTDERKIDEFSNFGCIAGVGIKIFNNADDIKIVSAQLISK
jgi:hypothetical protein